MLYIDIWLNKFQKIRAIDHFVIFLSSIKYNLVSAIREWKSHKIDVIKHQKASQKDINFELYTYFLLWIIQWNIPNTSMMH